MAEVVEDVMVVNTLGMHARPAASLVHTTLKFACDVHIHFKGNVVNAKSIMGLLTLGAARGSRLTVTCNGPDADAAMAAVRQVFASGFGED